MVDQESHRIKEFITNIKVLTPVELCQQSVLRYSAAGTLENFGGFVFVLQILNL